MAPKSPSEEEVVSRRTFIASTGAAGLAGLAGCQSTDDLDGSGGDDGGSGADSSGDGGSGSRQPGEVVITGSSTVFPISDAIAERFMDGHPEVNVTVDSTGSGGGFENHFCPGDSDVNGASRPITDAEVDHCSDNGIEPVEFEVAGDALTVAVNNEADWVDCLTFEELSKIWREDGAERWSDVREEWPDEEFDLYGPASTSGTYDWFNEHVVGEDHAHTSQHEPTEDDDIIVRGVRDSPYAMGYLGYAYYSENADRVKAVEIEAEQGASCTPPSLENATDGSYPLARPLFIYASEAAIQRKAIYEFLAFYLERAATDLVADIGYVPASEQMRNRNLATLARTHAGITTSDTPNNSSD